MKVKGIIVPPEALRLTKLIESGMPVKAAMALVLAQRQRRQKVAGTFNPRK